jgi:hypothetical protein
VASHASQCCAPDAGCTVFFEAFSLTVPRTEAKYDAMNRNESEKDETQSRADHTGRDAYRVLTVLVDLMPMVEHVKNPFDHCKKLIGAGYVELKTLDDGVILLCDEEGSRVCYVCGGSGWTDGSATLRRDGRQSTECIACNGAGARWPHNRDIPARAPTLPEAAFVAMTDPRLAAPGTMGVHRVHGPFVLARHDRAKDQPMSLTDGDLEFYCALFGGWMP